MPYEHITNMARLLERKASGIRINLSSDSIQSYFARVPKSIHIENNILYVDNIKRVYDFLSHYASEDSLYKIQQEILEEKRRLNPGVDEATLTLMNSVDAKSFDLKDIENAAQCTYKLTLTREFKDEHNNVIFTAPEINVAFGDKSYNPLGGCSPRDLCYSPTKGYRPSNEKVNWILDMLVKELKMYNFEDKIKI